MHTPPPQEKKGGGGLAIVAVLLALLILVGGGVGFAYSQGYIGKTARTAPTDTAKVGSTAPDTVTAVTVTANPTDTGPIEALVDAGKPNTNSFVGQPTVHKDAGAVAVNTAPTFTAPTTYTTYTPTYTTPTYTAPPTFTAPPGPQPAECRAARLMKEQGREQQAAQLALRCMRKGGAPPF
jgi:hypothetical protein